MPLRVKWNSLHFWLKAAHQQTSTWSNSNRNTRKKMWNVFKVENKDGRTTSIMLFFIDNFKFFQGFYCWIWTSKCLLGIFKLTSVSDACGKKFNKMAVWNRIINLVLVKHLWQSSHYNISRPAVCNLQEAKFAIVLSREISGIFGTAIYGWIKRIIITLWKVSKYRKIRTRNNSVSGHFSRSEYVTAYSL